MSALTQRPIEFGIITHMNSLLSPILKMLDKPTSSTRTSKELREQRAAIDLAKLGARVSELERLRRQLLLTGTDAELCTNDQDLAAARLQVERGGAAAEEVDRLLAEAEARERAADIQAKAQDARKEGAKLAKTYAEVDELTSKLRDLLAAAAVSCANLHRWNARAEKVAPDWRVEVMPVEAVKRRIHEAIK